MPTQNRIQNHWIEVEKFIKQEWPRLSDSSIHDMDGNYDRFLKCLKDTYGNFPLEEARARGKIQNFLNKLEDL